MTGFILFLLTLSIKYKAMNLPKRIEDAIHKLYSAFHHHHLNPECHSQCAVGNICNNTTAWQHLTEHHGSGKLSYVGMVHQQLGRKFYGFSPFELLQIEQAFLKGCGYPIPLRSTKKKRKLTQDNLFDGLTEVVSFLCRLEKIEDVMDCSQLFDYQAKTPQQGKMVQKV